jgi:hypothetical protein
MVRMPAGHLPSPPMEAARLFPEPAAGEPYTILIMLYATLRYCKMLKQEDWWAKSGLSFLIVNYVTKLHVGLVGFVSQGTAAFVQLDRSN